jgi:hypothetical protein
MRVAPYPSAQQLARVTSVAGPMRTCSVIVVVTPRRYISYNPYLADN